VLRIAQGAMSEPARAAPRCGGAADQRLLAAALRAVLRLALGRTFRADVPVATQRRRLLGVSRLTLPPRNVQFTATTCGGVAGEWAQVRAEGPASLTILYLHGGGYCTGAPASHRALTGHLAARSGARAFAADYRLAPEHPFPAAIDDAVGAWRGLVAQGIPPDEIVIAGDSAGGGLAVATALRLRELALPLPRALVLFSPWVDLGLGQLCREAPEVMLDEQWLQAGARSYAGRSDLRHPLISPLHADLHGLPATLVQVGSDELLRHDARRLHDALRDAGVDSRLEEFPGRWHVFQACAGLLRDADRALESAARFMRAGAPTSGG
jgi:acetyl esterase/lipase